IQNKSWFYEEFGWENSDSTPFDKVDEQNNEDSTLEQSTESLVHKEVKTSTPNSKYKNRSNDSQQTIPLKINFTQTTISPWFRGYDGYNIEEAFKDLVSADNRRLYCLKKAVKNEAKFNKVPAKI
ncbi:25375_t:CDS:2, partial [Gigaspora margarita]